MFWLKMVTMLGIPEKDVLHLTGSKAEETTIPLDRNLMKFAMMMPMPWNFLLASLILKNDWIWWCSMCQRCIYVCPMKIDIPQLVYNIRGMRPRDERPKGILGSCVMALRNDTCSAMGAGEEDFQFVVEDVLEEYQEAQPEFAEMQAPIDKEGAEFFLNQNSREPVTEPDELLPLWKILHLAGADWTYGSKGWAGENYCMFLADNDNWEHITRTSAKQADDLGCTTYLNTE